MKLYYYITFIAFFIGVTCCSSTDEHILGVWNVKSDFYTATYSIEKQGKKIIGKLLYYNDNTRILQETGTAKDIVFHNLKSKNGVFVDAISGATRKAKTGIEIKIKHQDTLEVTTYIHKKPLKEFWVRKSKER